MTEAERLDFEGHYFECPECAADLESGAVLAANANAVFAEEARRPVPAGKPGWWLAWKWPIVAFASLLLLMVGFQELYRIPALKRELAAARQPRAYPAFFLHSVVRSDDQQIEVPRGADFIGLAFDVPPGRLAPAYTVKLLDDSGRERWSLSAPPPASPGEPIHVLLPAPILRDGTYQLLLLAPGGTSSGTELQRIQFVLRVP